MRNDHAYISRPECPLHPEHRVQWPVVVDDVTIPYPVEDLRGWDQILTDGVASQDMEKTCAFYNKLAFKMGVTLRRYEERLWSQYKNGQNIDEKKEMASLYNMNAMKWKNAVTKITASDKSESTLTYHALVKRADPVAALELNTGWNFEIRAAEITRERIIQECCDNGNLLYPVRRTTVTQENGEQQTVMRRAAIWDWARPDVCGKKPRFWSLNRWPLHLQSEDARAEIIASGPRSTYNSKRSGSPLKNLSNNNHSNPSNNAQSQQMTENQLGRHIMADTTKTKTVSK
jgi:hypothetical protein